MELPLNRNVPNIMHIDLNSCFATIAQQANPLLRGKPVVIAAYDSPRGCIVSPSMEAKRFGIKTGMRVMEARLLCNKIIVRTPDPYMIRDVHMKFKKIFNDYSPIVIPKSIDEAVIVFDHQDIKKNLLTIAGNIKKRLRNEIGEWISCSIGIGTNRFFAKTAASLKKPDGLEVMSHENACDVYERLVLTDLCGINIRYQARLNIHGIFTPRQFLKAPLVLLQKKVFKSIVGFYWYKRLRGWEIDDIEFKRKSIGQDYSLGKPTANPEFLSQILMKLCEKMGRRLRRHGYVAHGIHVACIYHDGTHWHKGKKSECALYTTMELYQRAQLILNLSPEKKIVTKIGVSCYDFLSESHTQLTLFDGEVEKKRRLSDTVDQLNDRYGEFVITPAMMLGMEDVVIDRIAFGGAKELEDVYG